MRRCCVEIDLVGADAETTQRQKFRRRLEGGCGHLGARANSGQTGTGEGGVQFGRLQRGSVAFNAQSCGQQGCIGNGMQVFKQDSGLDHAAFLGI